MTVRAKFKVAEIKMQHVGAGQEPIPTFVLFPVYGPGNENWSKYTPTGRLEMTITNPAAADQFKLGQHLYVDFSPAEELEPLPK